MATHPPSNPMSQPHVWNAVAEGYVSDTAPHLARYAADALRFAELAAGESVVDVATGPGTLALQAAEVAQVTAIDFAPEMIGRLSARARELGKSVDARVADGMALPFEDGRFDAAFSMFGLIFFPDRDRGFRELLRVLKPAGRAVVSSWKRFEPDSAVARVFGAFFADLPPSPMAEQGPPLSGPGELEREMSAAGFANVELREISHVLEADSTAELCASMIRGNVAVQLLLEGIDVRQRAEYERNVLERLEHELGPGPQRIPMPAYLALGWK